MTQDSNAVPPPPPPSDPAAGSPPPPPPPAATVNYETPMGGAVVEMNKDARTWGMVAHLSALVGILGVPSLLGPLVVWLIKKNEMPFVDDQGKEALNFNLTVLFAALACIPLIFCFGIGVVALIAVMIVALVLSIIAALKANEGIAYRYPLTIRLVK